ncbi:MAG: patatin-like phospholipase family protein [Acidobacteriia bacterium]|nr:patatin-like phospholipase family protein [Terriglobia bacterium]
MSVALVLSAGGMFGAWEVGVWKALSERFQPDLIVGASAGAWNGWSIAGGCTIEELVAEWMDPHTAQIMQPGLHRFGVLRPGMLHERARSLFRRFQPRIPFGLTLAEVPRLRPCLVRDREITWQHLAAACSIPFGFPPVRIGGKQYVDGGLLGALPLWAAEEMGATRAIAVNALNTLPFRVLHKVMRARRPTAALEVTLIEPSTPLGSLRSAVVWSRANIERWIAQGECDGKQAAGAGATLHP